MSTIKEYLSELSGRRVTVIGMGVSNIPLIKMLLRAGVEVTVRDRSPRERPGRAGPGSWRAWVPG